ncbi:sugar ABC transporter substrate-binding protein [Hespellia stercorisuis]|uniref:Monosaccharide ABC transporter substrate-binding protein, CUT2 family (TC 3.A.1.2.-) n=1 Tax=Hespellia stercorisuis DSM 15480 TaxID=1121950 RepID=A0A1M6M191_9FIRM|nr:sugar ABC transporter substrate-binding protein [Hespellia stercorisuis]SHJ77083.1 monosaccharide ABC transporter substrate-binding protein, CUT2 family (TC 3.A.1.2.-) [Hespellia stercorisuis DSM 15480]
MKKRLLSIFVMAMLVSSILCGCKKNVGTSEDNAVVEEKDDEEESEDVSLTFGYTCIDMSNPYFQALQLAIQTELEEKGDRLISFDAALSEETQLKQIDTFIEKRVDAVFLCPVDWEGVTPGLEKLKEAGIPIINIDTEVKEIDLVDAYVGSDNKNAGYVCGANLVEEYPEGGKIIVLECPTMNSINDRITGFEEAIANKGFEVIAREDTQGDLQESMDATKRLLEKYDDIDAIMCGNDQTAIGALVSVREANRRGILIYGVDGSPDLKKELVKSDTSCAGTGAQSPVNVGQTAVNVALAVINGEPFEKTTYEETFFIDKDNVELYGTDGWQ